MGDHAKGVAALMDGEAFSPTLYTTLSAAGTGILGSDGTAGAAPAVICAKVPRGGMSTVSKADNTAKRPFPDTTKTGKCIGGTFTEVAAADELNHNAVGDATIKCRHL